MNIFVGIFTAIYELGAYLVGCLVELVLWAWNEITYFLLDLAFRALEAITGGLDWLPELVWTENLKYALEVANNVVPVTEAWNVLPFIMGFEGSLLVFKFSRWLIWS